jgi:hypothetical protein
MFGRKRAEEDTEAKIIERARDRLRHVERWGRWYLAFCWAGGIVFVGILYFAGYIITQILQKPGFVARRGELVIGLVFGALFSAGLFQIAHGVLRVWERALPDHRDQLLVQYHDALSQIVGHRDQPIGERNSEASLPG